MKTLKFTPELCALIVTGQKKSTWRLFDDKNLQVGDELSFINKITMQSIGTGVITKIIEKTLGSLEESDWSGHERYSSEEAMYSAYRSYYGNKVTPDTEIKLVWFTFSSPK